MIRKLLYTILMSIFLLPSLWAVSSKYASVSVLDTGKWVKVRVAETGVYKLTFSDLKKMGFTNPEKVSVYGYGGWPQDEDFSTTYIDDLPEVATYRGSDYLAFYAKGPVKWAYVLGSGFIHTNNPYSSYGYYFLTDRNDTVKSMETQASASGASLQISTFNDYKLWEKESVSVNSSGRELYGESFETTLSQNFKVSIPGITNDTGLATLSFIAKPTSGTGTVTMSINGSQTISGSFAQNTSEYIMARELNQTVTWSGDKTENTTVNIQYNTAGHKNVRLNYFCLQMFRTLQLYDAYTLFRSVSSIGNTSRFVIQNATSGLLVFDVTDGVNPKLMETTLNGTELSFSIPGSSALREFALVDPAKLTAPETVGEVTNQNLHAMSQQDMIILAQPALAEQAERLASAHLCTIIYRYRLCNRKRFIMSFRAERRMLRQYVVL